MRALSWFRISSPDASGTFSRGNEPAILPRFAPGHVPESDYSVPGGTGVSCQMSRL
jgi:hypothetical protein